MNWEQLFTSNRLQKSKRAINADRDSYQRDYDRIIFSDAFRKMQNKTQVFPMPNTIFVHNRLTHSLEVASVGRSLGQNVGKKIIAKNPNLNEDAQHFYREQLGKVISAACLAHDIGNPPFGHSGEQAIRDFFMKLPKEMQQDLQSQITVNQWQDLIKYEGNSVAFRIITDNFTQDESMYNLTLTTIASIIKYPVNATNGFDKKKEAISFKKAGYLDSEKDVFELINNQFDLPKLSDDCYARHPFVYLTEVADDICYRIIDMEDAHRIGIISTNDVLDLFLPFFNNEKGFYAIKNIQNRIENITNANSKIAYLRAMWIGLMIEKITDTFIENEKALLDGTLNDSLIDVLGTEYDDYIKAINTVSYKKIYLSDEAVKIELAGFTVIETLLQQLLDAILMPSGSGKKLLHYLELNEPIENTKDIYTQLLIILDFIVSCTDNYAVDLYRKIKGISL